MLRKLQRSIINFVVNKPFGILSAIFIAVVLSGVVVLKGWKEHQYKIVNNFIELHNTASGDGIYITWEDNSDDETGFIIQRKTGVDGIYSVLSSLETDESTYTDSTVVSGNTYCYKIGAFNIAGVSYTDDACTEFIDYSVETEIVEESEDVDSYSNDVVSEDDTLDSTDIINSELNENINISVNFIDRKSDINLDGKEFYSFKSDTEYNENYSVDSITDINYDINDGNVTYTDSSAIFVFNDQDNELENGFITMSYNESNSIEFVLSGNGEEQVASLYMSAGAWTSDDATFLVSVGGSSEIITLPSTRSWHYLKMDIAFNDYTKVKITPIGNFQSYSGIRLGGIVLNNATEVVSVNDVSNNITYFNFADLDDAPEIDVADVKYVTSEYNVGNNSLSLGNVTAISYQGDRKYSEDTYTFVNADEIVAKGYTQINWDKDSSINITLESDTNDLVQTSLFLKLGAWVSTDIKEIELQLILNGEENIIELPQGYKWFYTRIDFEFSGNVDVELKPLSSIGGYSKIKFAGVTMQ